ncbi:MAG: exodeoxyribonuclease V subunit alpha [Gammaproteobacteria bacterium]|nr:MAG: exodeoxyribonuclease V subunit alpha [Gammaproteobacteria bacterium]
MDARICQELSRLACHFARFADGDGLVAVTVAWLVERCLEGDVCVDLREKEGRALFEGMPPMPALAIWCKALAAHPWIGSGAPLVLDGHRLYLARHFRNEVTVAQGILSRLPFDPIAPEDVVRTRLSELFPDGGEQKAAVAAACARRFAVITGGPGTGKTTTVLRLIALWRSLSPDLRIALSAPTGKAAGRLAESLAGGVRHLPPDFREGIPHQAATLHRLLKVGGEDPHGPEHPLPLDALVVDEASMVDLALMARLMESLPQGARIVLLGDREQLASVEAGSVLGDITGRGARLPYSIRLARWLEKVGAPVAGDPVLFEGIQDAIIELRESHRFHPRMGVGRLARAIREGDMRSLRACLKEEKDVKLWLQAGQEPGREVLRWMDRHFTPVFEAPDVKKALDALSRARVLSALRSGPWGEEGMVARFEAGLARRGRIQDPSRPYHGLPIIVVRNDYETGLFNGDVGLLWREGGRLRACFPEGEGIRRVPLRQLPEWRKAWVMTVHRAQGSEFDAVLLVLPPPETPVLTRELIYTGVTRARRHCIIASSRGALEEGLKRRVGRTSGLAWRLGWARL